MSNPHNGSKHGKRGGTKHHKDFIASLLSTPTKDGGSPVSTGCSQNLVNETAPFCECSGIRETVETHLIPRKSITLKQHLMVLPRHPVDTIEVRNRQAEKVDGKITGRMIPGSDRKILTMSDTTLLQRGNPFQDAWESRRPIKRMASRSKRIVNDPENTFGTKANQNNGLNIDPTDDTI